MKTIVRLLAVLLVGVAVGLVYGWLIQPVHYVDTAPATCVPIGARTTCDGGQSYASARICSGAGSPGQPRPQPAADLASRP
jgi:hypothetical protein